MSLRPLLAALVLCAALLGASPAGAQEAPPITPLPPAPQQPAPAPAPDDDGLSPRQQLLIAVAGILLLVGIAWGIVRDARRRAPVEEGARQSDGTARPKGTRPPPQRRASQSRAKARAARRARKRNR